MINELWLRWLHSKQDAINCNPKECRLGTTGTVHVPTACGDRVETASTGSDRCAAVHAFTFSAVLWMTIELLAAFWMSCLH